MTEKENFDAVKEQKLQIQRELVDKIQNLMEEYDPEYVEEVVKELGGDEIEEKY